MPDERLRRWRLVLGGDEADGTGVQLRGQDAEIDNVLGALYDADRKAGLSGSNPQIARWLGDIRTFFPTSVVRVMQQDAMERLNLRQMLLEPELLNQIEPDIHLVSTLISLSSVIPSRSATRPGRSCAGWSRTWSAALRTSCARRSRAA